MPKLHNEVAFQVQRNALILGEFTIKDMIRITGLNPNSVRNEVQQLLKRELLIGTKLVGKREYCYRLSDNPEKRRTLSQEVESFYTPPDLPPPTKPTCPAYREALEQTKQALEIAEPDARAKLLSEASEWLEAAWQTEGAGLAPDLVKAHIWRERGRLEVWEGKHSKGQDHIRRACVRFAEANEEGELCKTEEYEVWAWAIDFVHQGGVADPLSRFRCLLRAINRAPRLDAHPLWSEVVQLGPALEAMCGGAPEQAAPQETFLERVAKFIQLGFGVYRPVPVASLDGDDPFAHDIKPWVRYDTTIPDLFLEITIDQYSTDSAQLSIVPRKTDGRIAYTAIVALYEIQDESRMLSNSFTIREMENKAIFADLSLSDHYGLQVEYQGQGFFTNVDDLFEAFAKATKRAAPSP